MKRTIKNSAGFTIVELMIATSVLATLLLMATIIMVSIGTLYYKGVSVSSVQDNARSLSDELAQHLELNNGNVTFVNISSSPASGAYCIGPIRYTYVLNLQVSNNSTSPQHVIWRDITPSSGCGASLPAMNTLTPTSSGSELIAPNSRLTAFSITSPSAPLLLSPYTVIINEVYGDPTLSPNGVCAGITGDQFCAASSLTTVVSQRM